MAPGEEQLGSDRAGSIDWSSFLIDWNDDLSNEVAALLNDEAAKGVLFPAGAPDPVEPQESQNSSSDLANSQPIQTSTPDSLPSDDSGIAFDQSAESLMLGSNVALGIGVVDPQLLQKSTPDSQQINSGLAVHQQAEPLTFGTNGPQYDQQTYPAINGPFGTYYPGTNGWPTTPLFAPVHHPISYPTAPYPTTTDQMNYLDTTLQTTAPLTMTPCSAMPLASNPAGPEPESPPRPEGKRNWSDKEDDCLRACPSIQTDPGKKTQWKEVEKYMRDHGHDRDSKQCREHWINYADPRLVEDAWYRVEQNKQAMVLHCTDGEAAHNWETGAYPNWATVEKKLEADETLVPPGRRVAPNIIKNTYHMIKEGKDFKAHKAGRSVTRKRKNDSASPSSSDQGSRKKRSSGESAYTLPDESLRGIVPPEDSLLDVSPPDGSPSDQRHPDDDVDPLLSRPKL